MLEGVLPFKFTVGVLPDVKLFDPCRWPKSIRPLYTAVVAMVASHTAPFFRWPSCFGPLVAVVVAALASHAVSGAASLVNTAATMTT